MDGSINAFVFCGSGDGIDIGCRDVNHGRRRLPMAARGCLCDRSAPQEQQAFDIEDEICQADLGRRPGDPDGADEKFHPVLLLSEDMLDARPDFRFRVVGPAHGSGHRPTLRLLAMDVADEAVLGQGRLVDRRPIGGIGPHPARRIGLIEQAFRRRRPS